jgi:hypothetical protein
MTTIGVGHVGITVEEQKMKCLDCGVETGFEWPEDEKIRTLWQRAWEGPLCKSCAGHSPLSKLMDEETKDLVYALRKKKV